MCGIHPGHSLPTPTDVCVHCRMAANTSREITGEEILNCPHEMAPGVGQFTMDSPAPLVADANGRYPVPQPGIVTDREY